MSNQHFKVEFYELMNEILVLAEDCKKDSTYLGIANKCKKMFELIEALSLVKHYPHYNHLQQSYNHYERTLNTVLNSNKYKTINCPKCGRCVKTNNLARHKKSMVCKQIESEKTISADTGNSKMTVALQQQQNLTNLSKKIRKMWYHHKLLQHINK